jgi:16S rRNA A1518/A1519 N6-dimethyltransferase RsmA/KsgA/DIM1 with predicted DNA glycosylase/AP lyase activity
MSREARDLIRRLFTQRRKQIGSQLAKEPVLREWLERLPEFGASRSSRPEDIPLKAWKELNSVMVKQIRSGSEP